MVLYYFCSKSQKTKTMAKPIKETPVLTGNDADRFHKATENVVPISEKEKAEAEKLFQELRRKNPEIFSML